MKGKIKFFIDVKNYGYVTSDDDTGDYQFSRRNVQNDPLNLPFFVGESVSFDLDEQNQGGKIENRKIMHMTRELTNECWRRGKVESFDTKKGHGFIIDAETNNKYFIHYSSIKERPGVKIKKLHAGEDVAFVIGENTEGNETTVNCIPLDSRPIFYRNFNFPAGYGETINKLANMSSKEDDVDWNYTHERSEYNNPVLFSYLQHTLLRIVQQKTEQDLQISNKQTIYILEGADVKGKRQYLFNTGLQTDYGEDIFALFEDDQQKVSKWTFIDFFAGSHTKLVMLFGDRRPDIAIYLDNPIDFVYDARLTVIPDVTHILETNFQRLPADIQENSKKDLGELLRNRTKDAEKKVKRNYRVAVPQFYGGSVQLLLPLCLSASDKVDRALVIERIKSKDGQSLYRGSTILTLSQAYNNARLISPQDRAWLLP